MSMKVFNDIEVDALCEGVDCDLFEGWRGSGIERSSSPDNQLGSKVYSIYDLSSQLMKYSHPPFKIVGDEKDAEVTLLKTGHLFLPPPETIFYEVASVFPIHLHPFVSTYVDTWKELGMTLLDFEKIGTENSKKQAEKINGFALTLAKRLKHSSLQRQVSATDKHCRKQYKQCIELYNSLSGKQEAVIIKRLDLWVWPQAVALSEDQLLMMLTSMLQQTKDDVLKRIKGVVVKTQFSAFWGLGLNVTFFLESATVMRGWDLADYLGDFWSKVVCNGRGVHMNCEIHSNGFMRAGIGLHYFEDALQEQQVLSSFAYITKVGRFLLAGNGVAVKLLV